MIEDPHMRCVELNEEKVVRNEHYEIEERQR